MGSYDTLVDPATGEEHQTKALGRAMQTFRAGDVVRPERAPLSEADHEAVRAGRWNPAIRGLSSTSVQLRLQPEGGRELYADVVERMYTGISAERDRSVPLIDHYGRLVDETATDPRGVPYSPSFIVAYSLDDLRGPTTGEIELPHRLIWNPSSPFDIGDEKHHRSLMRIVLREARNQRDLADYIDRDSVIRHWSTLALPDYIRRAWEVRFSELGEPREP